MREGTARISLIHICLTLFGPGVSNSNYCDGQIRAYKVTPWHGRPQRWAKRAFAHPRNKDYGQKSYRKPKTSSLIPTERLRFWNDGLFAGMTLTLHKNQFHWSGVMQWWACSSLMTAHLPAETVWQTFERASVGFIAKQQYRNKSPKI